MKEIEKLSLQEMRKLLSQLKEYKDITKKLWDRGRAIFLRSLSWETLYRVEYFPSLSEENVYESALSAYKKVFWVTPKKEEIQFIQKESILGGMKIYKNDEMVDMSFSKVERLLKK